MVEEELLTALQLMLGTYDIEECRQFESIKPVPKNVQLGITIGYVRCLTQVIKLVEELQSQEETKNVA